MIPSTIYQFLLDLHKRCKCGHEWAFHIPSRKVPFNYKIPRDTPCVKYGCCCQKFEESMSKGKRGTFTLKIREDEFGLEENKLVIDLTPTRYKHIFERMKKLNKIIIEIKRS